MMAQRPIIEVDSYHSIEEARNEDGATKHWLHFAPAPFMVTDINQIKVGQVYGLIEPVLSWGATLMLRVSV